MGGRGAKSASGGGKASESIAQRITREMTAENDAKNAAGLDYNSGWIGDYVPDWVIEQKLGFQEAHVWNMGGGDDYVKRESEKAILVARPTKYGEITVWVPKSQMQGGLGKYQLQSEINYKIGGLYNEYLRNTAKKNKVKIGSVRKTQKILDKLNEAGVEFMDKQQFKATPYEKLFG